MATNSQTAWWIKEYIKKSHEKDKMEKKNTPHENSKEKGTTQREKTLRFIQLSWKLFVFLLNDKMITKMNKSKTTHPKSQMSQSFQWSSEILFGF